MALLKRLECAHRNCGHPVTQGTRVVNGKKVPVYVHVYEKDGVKARHEVGRIRSVDLGRV